MDILSLFDFFSQAPSLKINKSDKYYTIFGLIISFISIIFILGMGFYFSLICLQKKNFQILERNDYNLNPSFKLFDIKLMLLIVDPYGKEFEESDRLYSIDAKLWDINPSAENKSDSFNLTDIPLINRKLIKNEQFEDELKKVTYNTSKVFNNTNLDKILYGKYGNIKG